MPLFWGEKEIDQVFWGDKEISQIYWGDKEIWSNAKIEKLGKGKSWDIKALFPNLYNKLTANNFFALSAETASGTNSIHMSAGLPSGYREYAGFSGGLTKSYDPSTGQLTFCCYVSPGHQANIELGIVTHTEKLIDLGTDSSVDIKTKSANYKNLTEDNFIVLDSKIASGGNTYGAPIDANAGDAYSDSGSATVKLEKSYDASTGILSCYVKLVSRDTGGVYTYFNFTRTNGCHVYLSEKL